MRIGIITFHWAVNYGAILQTYALQTYLEKKGHEVWIINYKPKKYDLNYKKLLSSPRTLFSIKSFYKERKKDKELQKFRDAKLNLTRRYFSTEELKNDPPNFDVYISGSDQILNPSFTLCGENKPTSAYYLDFGSESVKRIGYAVSFGCVEYPFKVKLIAEPLLKKFDFISVREITGINILKSMNYTKSDLSPDPTLLLDKIEYDKLIDEKETKIIYYNYVYILRKFNRYKELEKQIDNIRYSDENEYSISKWLANIKNANSVITNSYHGIIFCIKYNIPFIVLLDTKENIGMNDRFYTLLEKIGLIDRIISYDEINLIQKKIQKPIDWNTINDVIKCVKFDINKNINF